MRLGELLVSEGTIAPKQLQRALEAQLAYGGHLGTCLIELGMVDEEQLGDVLARCSGMQCATSKMLSDVPPEVTRILPRKIVEKHHVIPFRLAEQTLDVAMRDPRDLQAVDELNFATGLRVQPWIAPEVRIFQAMERYYDVPRRTRYVALCCQLDGAEPEKRQGDGWLIPAGHKGRFEGYQEASQEHEPDFITAPSARAAVAVQARPQVEDTLGPISALLCGAETRKELAQLVLEYATERLGRSILFKVIDDSAVVWDAAGEGIDGGQLAGLSFPVTGEAIFRLLRGREMYRGALPEDGCFVSFYSRLEMELPNEILVIPVYLDDRLKLLFYADGGRHESLSADTAEFSRLMRKLAMSLSLVDLKTRIQSV